MELSNFRITEDINYTPQSDIIYPPEFVNAYVLAGGAAATTVTIPAGARIALISATGNFYVNWGTVTAAVPTVNITTGDGPELNPGSRDVTEYSSFSMIAPSDCIVTIAYFK